MNQTESKGHADFYEAVSVLKQKLMGDDLYRDGCIYIVYDREDHCYYVCEDTGANGTSLSEYNMSEEFCQTRILTIDISSLDEEYETCKRENSIEELTDDQREGIIDFVVDNAYEEMEMEADETAALFELNLIDAGRYAGEVRTHVDSCNESGSNLKYYLESLKIPKQIKLNIIDVVKSNPQFDLQVNIYAW